MKTSNAMLLAVLALLLAGAAEAQSPVHPTPMHQTQVQTMPSGTHGGASRADAMRPATVAGPPVPHRPPSFVRPPFFFRPPFLFRHPFFFSSGLIVAGQQAAPAPSYVYSYGYPVYVQSAAYAEPQAQYWAYCRSPQGYYPYISECPAGWLPVTPTSPPPPMVPGQTSLDAPQQPKTPPGGGDSIEEIRARIARSRAD
jgi:hypothetical protein